MNKIIDLTHVIKKGMPVYPQTLEIGIEPIGIIESDGFRELALRIFTHTGTHIDSPAHILPKGKSIDQFPVSHFSGNGIALEHSKENPLMPSTLKKMSSELKAVDFILIYTAYSKFWGSKKYFKNIPLPESGFFEYVAELPIKGIGIDAISIDAVGSETLPNHQSILSKDIIIIENLSNLDLLVNKRFQFNCFPLLIENGDGSPVRATAQLFD